MERANQSKPPEQIKAIKAIEAERDGVLLTRIREEIRVAVTVIPVTISVSVISPPMPFTSKAAGATKQRLHNFLVKQIKSEGR